MRGRSLLREPTGQSLCAFCAHRLGAARQPSHVQRRFLQSSRSSLKPPAEGVAFREDDGNGSTIADVRSEPLRSTRAGLGPMSSWSPPTFGNGMPPASPTAGWGRPNGGNDEIPRRQMPVSPFEAAPKAEYSDLLPHEQRARKVMLDTASLPREVNIPMGPGPAATRNARPVPHTEAERQAWAKAALAKQKAREVYDTAEQQQPGNGRRLARNVAWDSRPPRRSNDAETELPQWSSLKRRGGYGRQAEGGFGDAARRQPKSIEDQFTEGRAQREEQAKTARYIPLNRTVEVQDSTYGNARSHQRSRFSTDREAQSRSNSPMKLDASESQSSSMNHRGFNHPSPGEDELRWRSGFTERRNLSDRDDRESFVPRSIAPEPEVRFKPMGSVRESVKELESEPTFDPRDMLRQTRGESAKQRLNFDELQKVEDEQDSRRKKPGRFTEKAVYDDMPKGRGRDKARRRQQFIEDEEDEGERAAALEKAELKRQRKLEKAARKAATPTPILLPEYISVSNLAVALKVKVDDFVEKMEELGFEETNYDYILNAENAGLIAMEYNFEAIIDKGDSEDLKPREPAEDPSVLPQRPPVVTIMGHVDHGKTTLLDWLRKSSVAATEHGGITQHIGAFSVPMPSGKIITFLDTPGHAAFLSMRQRGANVTDIVILVVAADDSVKPQTIEAIKHAQAAKVPIIVAINKIDKEESNVDRVKQDLARHGVDVEDYGGDTQVVCVSGKTGQGMEELEQAAVALSEIIDMRAETDGQAEGWVLEASIKSMGKVATVLVRRGTMRPGDFIVAGKTWARIRCLRNEAGVEIAEAGPGTPVEIDGWREQPLAGDEALQAPDESKAKSVVDYRLEKEERDKMALDMEAINENRKAEQEKREREKAEAAAAAEALANDEEIAEKIREKPSGVKEIFFIVKGDVSGSVEAVIDSISAIGNAEVRPHILRSGVGQLCEFDVEHAAAANGLLVNFNTVVDPNISQLAAQAKVSILDHNIIYRLVDDVKAELSKHLPPLITHRVLGEAEISEIFQITIKGRQQKPIAGSKVRNGTISKNAKVRVLRGGENVFDGTLASLKSVKKDVQEMKKGSECGIGFDGWFDFQVGDHVQSYEELSEKRYL